MVLVPALLLVAASPLAGAATPVASPPTVDARLEGGMELGGPAVSSAAGLAVGAGVPITERVTAEVEALVGVDPEARPRASGFGGLRVGLGHGFSVTAAAGGGWRPGGPLALGRAGVAWDLPLGPMSLRLSAMGEGSARGGGVLVGAGVTVPLERRATPIVVKAAAPPPPEVAAELPEAAEPPIEVNPPDALVWVPHPVCAWVPAERAANLLAVADPELPVQVRAPGYLPSELPRDGSRSVTLQPAPPFGAVVVVAWPGDRVSIDDVAFPLAADGTAVFGAPEGPLKVTVAGAGRKVDLEGAVAAGYVLWLRAPEPAPLTVTFPAGSAALPAEATSSIQGFATNAGAYGFRVVGSWSGESDLGETRRLADARAEALKDALLAAGVPARAIDVISTVTPTPGAAPEALRVARVEPILPKEP